MYVCTYLQQAYLDVHTYITDKRHYVFCSSLGMCMYVMHVHTYVHGLMWKWCYCLLPVTD